MIKRCEGKWLDILTLVEPKLKNAAGNVGRHVPCPLPGHEDSKDGFRFFEDAAETGASICNTCGAFSDPVSLVMRASQCDERQAIQKIEKEYEKLTGEKIPKKVTQKKLSRTSEKSLGRAVKCHPRKTAYLKARGLEDSEEVLFSEREAHSKDADGEYVYRSALVVPVRDRHGDIINVNKIFLAEEHDGKSSLAPSKKFGPVVNKGDLRGGAIFLGKPGKIVAIAEGVETGLAIRQATGLPVAIMPANLMPYIEFPECVEEVVIYADNDKKNQGEKAAKRLAHNSLKKGLKVSCCMPAKTGTDFLDVLNEQGVKGIQKARQIRFKLPSMQNSGGRSNLVSCASSTGGGKTTEIGLYQLPLTRDYGKAPDFPVEALGVELEAYLKAILDYTQASIGIIASSIIAVVTLAVQHLADVFVGGRKKPISNFFLTIGRSGERKSTVDDFALKPVRDYERELRIEGDVAKMVYEAKVEEYKNNNKKRASLSDEKGELEVPDVAALPPRKPRGASMLIDDATIEGLMSFLQTEQPSIGEFSEEGGRCFGGHGMSSDNQMKTITAKSMLWDGKTITSIRKGDGVIIVNGVRMSSHLMIQPEVAKVALADKMLLDQGFWGRILISFPESTIGSRVYCTASSKSESVLLKYYDKIGALLRRSKTLSADGRSELLPRNLPLSPEAEILYINFYNIVEKAQGENGIYRDISPFASKAGEHALRIAAVLTLFDNSNAECVTSSRMENAITIIEYYLNEANRLLGTPEVNGDLQHAELTLKWMQRKPGELYSLVRIYQNGPRCVRNAKSALKVMAVLENHNWVENVGPKDIDTKRHEDVWELI